MSPKTQSPLTAELKSHDLKSIIQTVELAAVESFPDMIELEYRSGEYAGDVRKFFRIGITERRAIYREGVSYRIQQ